MTTRTPRVVHRSAKRDRTRDRGTPRRGVSAERRQIRPTVRPSAAWPILGALVAAAVVLGLVVWPGRAGEPMRVRPAQAKEAAKGPSVPDAPVQAGAVANPTLRPEAKPPARKISDRTVRVVPKPVPIPAAGPSRAAADERLAKPEMVSPDEFGEQVDLVKFGYRHWSAASGDTVDPDGDKGDFDDSFGAHQGRVDRPQIGSTQTMAGTVGKETCYAVPGSTVTWVFKVPGGGEYILAFRLWKEGRTVTRVTPAYQLVPGRSEWEDLPSVDNIPHLGGYGRTVCYRIAVPKGKTALRLRIRADSGRCNLQRAMLGKKADDPFLPAAQIQPVHPILYVTTETLPRVRAKIRQGIPKIVYEQDLLTSVNWYTNTLNRGDKAWGPKYTSAANHHVSRSIAKTAFLYLLSGKREHLNTVKRMVDVVNAWPRVADASVGQATGSYSVLVRGRVTAAIAMAYDWLYHDLDEATRAKWRALLHYEATALYFYNALGVSDGGSGNWDPWVGAGYGIAGLALGREHRWTKQWIESCKHICNVNLRYTGEDFGYFHNGFLKAMDFFACLYTATGENLFAHNHDHLRRDTEMILTHMDPLQDGYPSFGDTGHGSGSPLQAVLVASFLKDGLAQWLVNRLYCADGKAVRKWGWMSVSSPVVITFYDESVPEEDPANSNRLTLAQALTGTDPYLPKSYEFVHLRSGYGRATDVQLAFKCGLYSGWHGHPDQASPVLTAYGDHLLYDVGKNGGYGSPSNLYAKSARSHAQVFIDGRGQIDHSGPVFWERSAGRQGPLLHTDFVDHIRCDTTVAYRKNKAIAKAGHAYRHFLFVRKPDRHAYVVMIDDIDPGDGKTHQYEWLLHTNKRHTIRPQGNGHYLFDGKAQLDAWLIEPQGVSEKTSEKFNLRSLTVTVNERMTKGLFVALLYPKSKTMDPPKVKRLAGNGFVGLEVNGTDTFLIATRDQPIDHRGLRSDGKIVAFFAVQGPDAYLSVGATYLRHNNRELFRATRRVSVAIKENAGGAATLDEGQAVLTLHHGKPRTVQLTAGATPLSW